MMNENVVAVIGGDIENRPPPGSVRGCCRNSIQHPVWLTPASQRLVTAGAVVYCWACVREMNSEELHILGNSPQGVQKLDRGEFPFGPRRE